MDLVLEPNIPDAFITLNNDFASRYSSPKHQLEWDLKSDIVVWVYVKQTLKTAFAHLTSDDILEVKNPSFKSDTLLEETKTPHDTTNVQCLIGFVFTAEDILYLPVPGVTRTIVVSSKHIRLSKLSKDNPTVACPFPVPFKLQARVRNDAIRSSDDDLDAHVLPILMFSAEKLVEESRVWIPIITDNSAVLFD